MNKRILSLMLALTMIFSIIGTASAETGNKKVDWLVEKGYVVGDGGTGDLRLKANIAREEVATLIVKAIGKDDIVDAMKALPSVFTDMNPSVWSNGYVNVAHNEGIVNGFPDKSFGPKKDITYQEVIVMLVLTNGKLTEAEKNALPWPGPYIAKAVELGIVDSSLGITDYKAVATREKVFEMLYNTVYKKEDAKYENYKVIVTEIPRVSTLSQNEIGVVVLDNKDANPKRYNKESYTRLKHEGNFGDVENLLGKVLDVGIDKDNNIKNFSIDNSFSYLSGELEAKEKSISLNNKSYNVFFENRYENSIDKIQGVYHNDRLFNYKENYSKFTNDFSRITVKQGEVYFIESFNFTDVAPVKKVDKGEIFIVNDALLANERKVNLKKVMLYTEKEGFKALNLSNIKELDVLHIYDEDKAIVKQDVNVNGKFEKVLEGNNEVLVQISGKKYPISSLESHKAVYSLNGESFITLEPKNASKALEVLKNQDIRFGLDMYGHLQYIKADINFTERVAVIEEILNRAVRAVDSNKQQAVFNEKSTTLYNVAGFDQKQSLGIFSRGDLVYISNDGEYIEKMSRIATADQILTGAKGVKKNASGKFDLEREYITTKNTHAFILHGNKNSVSLEPTTLDYVTKNVDHSSNLQAYVISDAQFDAFKLDNRIQTTGRADVVNTIVFTQYKASGGNLNEQYFKAKYKFVPGRDTEVEGTDPEGKIIVRPVDKYSSVPTIEAGDIALLYISPGTDMIVKDAKIKIAEKSPWVEVVSLDIIEGNIASLTIRDEKGKRTEYWVVKDALEIGIVKEGSKVKVSLDDDKMVDIILVKEK